MLKNMVDTSDLVDARHDAASNSWVRNQADKMSGTDYIHSHHIRVGCLPTKSRTTRGTENDRMCRGGCMKSETNYHIIQECHRTHGGRVNRHDHVVKELGKHFENRNYDRVLVEPRLKTSVGLRKPDLLLVKEGKATIIDVQITSGRSLEQYHAQKRAKYRDIRGMEDLVKTKYGVNTVEFQAATFSYKGVIEKNTSKLFKELGINERFKVLMVSSVLRGAWKNWTLFNRITTMTRGGRFYL